MMFCDKLSVVGDFRGMWSAAILAGGHARRLGGRDKAALDIGRSTILERQLALLRPLVDHILIVASDADHTANSARFAAAGVPVVTDLKPGTGALGGLYTGIQAAATPRVLVTACDLPFLTTAFLLRLIADGRDADVVLPRTADGYHPLCAAYSRRAGHILGEQLDQGVRKVTEAVFATDDLVVRELTPDQLAPYDPDGKLFFNVNTPDDYARAFDLGAELDGAH
jgi:molybdopterin-guanine dinucleotide biosynthesis protein A